MRKESRAHVFAQHTGMDSKELHYAVPHEAKTHFHEIPAQALGTASRTTHKRLAVHSMFDPGRVAAAYLQEAYTLLAPTVRRRVKATQGQVPTLPEQTEPCTESNVP